MNIWIDLDNSPHVPFFAPIIRELEGRGHAVALTARDAYQVCDLANLFGLRYRAVGHHYGKHKLLKLYGTCVRTLQLLPAAWTMKPHLAVSHGSRAQILAAATNRIPSVVILDYEFAKGLTSFGPAWVMAPEMIPQSSIHHDSARVLRYPGIKEDVYVGGFKPDAAIKTELGLDDGDLIAIVRPPANEAHYHNPESETLFDAAIDLLASTPKITAVLLPRNRRQEDAIRRRWPELLRQRRIVIPGRPLDGLNLIWHSDLVISGGGTMNREAAALGVPVYSIFRGHIGAVDKHLAHTGRLTLLESVADVRNKIALERRTRPSGPPRTASDALSAVVNNIVNVLETKQ